MKKPITKTDQLKYYTRRSMALLNSIEGITGKMFHELDSQLERRIFRAHDSGNISEIRKVYLLLCEYHDNLSSDGRAMK
jgi:hypothetical protein